jgi:hypothetical protein
MRYKKEMNSPKVNEYDYINFLIATQKAYSGVEAQRVQPESVNPPAHDAITRLLHRLEPTPERLWQEAEPYVSRKTGILLVDDSTLDKLSAKIREIVTRHWSGKQGRVVQGINLISWLWTEGDQHIPLDYRFSEKSVDGAKKNEHFRAMLDRAKAREFTPKCVVFDSWSSSLENLKLIRRYQWIWLTRFKRNRHVNLDGTANRPLSEVKIASTGTVVHLKGYGLVKVFKIVAPNEERTSEVASDVPLCSVGDIDYWATNNLDLNEL